jgi:hypothetical protein
MGSTLQATPYEKPEVVDSFDSLEVIGDASGVATVANGCGSRLGTVSA